MPLVDNIHPLSATEHPKTKSFMFYGPPGYGKTTMAWKMLERMLARDPRARALWIDVDRKLAGQQDIPPKVLEAIDIWVPQNPLLSGNKIGIARQERFEDGEGGKKRIKGTEGYIPVDPKGFREVVAFLNELLDLTEKGEFRWQLAVMDTITTLVEHLYRLILFHHQVSAMTLPLWGVFATNVQELRSGFLALPCNRIMIAHVVTKEEKITKELQVTPSIQGQMGSLIGKDFNEMYFFQGVGKDNRYMLLTKAVRKYQCRTTVPGCPAEISVEDMIQRLLP